MQLIETSGDSVPKQVNFLKIQVVQYATMVFQSAIE